MTHCRSRARIDVVEVLKCFVEYRSEYEMHHDFSDNSDPIASVPNQPESTDSAR